MQTVNIRVYGIVQGVFFRRSVEDKANELKINGWVRNEMDGSVEVMATGDKEDLEALVTWCHEGPPLATVEKVETQWLSEVEDFGHFSIV